MAVMDRIRRGVGDPVLLGLVLTLSFFGVAMVYSVGYGLPPNSLLSGLWTRQLIWLGISLVALVILTRVPLQWYEWAAVPAYVVTIALLVLTLFIGTGAGTAQHVSSWLDLGPIAVQPAQFANVATILMLARLMGGWRAPPETIWRLWSPILVVAVPMLLILGQPDLGTAMIFGAVLLATLYWGGVPLSLIFMLLSPLIGLFLAFEVWMFSVYMILLVGFLYINRVTLWEGVTVATANLLAGTVALPLWNSLDVYQQNRILVFIDPSIDPQGAAYQLNQSMIAIGSGGLTGKGYLLGTQKGLDFLPEAHTDFIFSVVGEEFGLLGTAGVILVFGMLLWRLARLAESTPDPFAGIVVFGIFGAWFGHILVNIGMTVGLMPITGIPLPFLSYGGSFLLANFIALAVAQRIATERATT